MLAEKDSEVRKRFLQVAFNLDNGLIFQLQNECTDRIGKNGIVANQSYFNFIEWQPSDNEIALYTLYSYADLKIPREFSCIFDYQNPEISINAKMTLTQSICEGQFPRDFMEHGYKHISVFKFDEKIPDLITNLYLMKQSGIRESDDSLKLGVCDKNNFQEIKNNLLYIKELKNKHGADWSDFYV